MVGRPFAGKVFPETWTSEPSKIYSSIPMGAEYHVHTRVYTHVCVHACLAHFCSRGKTIPCLSRANTCMLTQAPAAFPRPLPSTRTAHGMAGDTEPPRTGATPSAVVPTTPAAGPFLQHASEMLPRSVAYSRPPQGPGDPAGVELSTAVLGGRQAQAAPQAPVVFLGPLGSSSSGKRALPPGLVPFSNGPMPAMVPVHMAPAPASG